VLWLAVAAFCSQSAASPPLPSCSQHNPMVCIALMDSGLSSMTASHSRNAYSVPTQSQHVNLLKTTGPTARASHLFELASGKQHVRLAHDGVQMRRKLAGVDARGFAAFAGPLLPAIPKAQHSRRFFLWRIACRSPPVLSPPGSRPACCPVILATWHRKLAEWLHVARIGCTWTSW
jgi:hypothetical protein